MSSTTPNLNLFKYNPLTDGKQVFSIDTALNNNWDKIDNSIVKKSGDTMTGNLILQGTSLRVMDIKNTSADIKETPTADINVGAYRIRDANNICGQMYTTILNNGSVQTSLFVRNNKNGTAVNSSIVVGVDANDDTYCSFPLCTTQATTTSTARRDKIAVIIENYKSGASWYRVWSDGWKEQGGTLGAVAGGTITTYPFSFVDTNYCLQVTLLGTAVRNDAPSYIKGITDFTVYHGAGLNNGLGFCWYACGY